VVATPLERLDHGLFRLVNGLGPAPDAVWSTLNPHLPNYLTLIALAAVAALLTGRRAMPAMAVVAASGVLAWTLLEGVYLLYDRARPEEVMGGVVLDGNSWRFFSSYPSGHAAVTVGLVVAAARVVPALRVPLWTYAAAVGLTRVLFGAHFPSDVLAGGVIGYVAAGLAWTALAHAGLLRAPEPAYAQQGAEHPHAVHGWTKRAVHAVVARRDRHPGDPHPGP
jgi:membrane-associated phospholipid phosphatase